ncbi:PfkB family carbohydrate kinase [Streptomyces yaizuensis]|uniref:Ribokinase n=1 Tax=Streptomyces yaizuensis TaxID=2989713 RepID=A0ABQ5NV54_9ACTN|nr:PfkB family carbohydrate kinase [Streptomyces sp. YSPA8]GLF94241.1 ribokinase [Streptomyces sp. YSPA8]
MTGIVVLGGARMDLVAEADRAPEPGESVPGRVFRTVPGGAGVNQAVAAARAGADTALIGAVGSDDFGAALRHTLEASGVDTDLLRTLPGPSGTGHLVVDGEGRTTAVTVPGANAAVTFLAPGDETLIATAGTLLLPLGIPLSAALDGALAARRHGVRTVLAPALDQHLPPELLDATDLLLAPEPTAAALTGTADPRAAAGALLRRVPAVVVLRGPAGCLYAARGAETLTVPASPVPTVDPLGTGDAFAGALAVALGEGVPAGTALHRAVTAAALCGGTPGAATSMPYRPEIDNAS